MSRFLTTVSNALLKKHGNDLSRVLILAPNQRSCTYLVNEIQAQAEGTVFAPEVLTLQNWIIEQSTILPMDNLDLVTDLYSCYRKINGEQTLDEFISTAGIILSDFNEIDLQLADAKSFFRNLELLQSMKTYEPGQEPGEYQLRYRRFWKEFGELYVMFRDLLLSKQSGYSGLIIRQFAQEPVKPDALSVYLVGFSGLTKSDEKIFRFLIKECNAELFIDADKYYVEDNLQEAGLPFRDSLSLYKSAFSQLQTNLQTKDRNIEIVGVAKNIGQVAVTAEILQNRLNVSEDKWSQTVVVVPDEKILFPLIYELPASVQSLNITMGVKIAGTNPSAFTDVLFRLFENSQKYRSQSAPLRFYYKDLFELLQHPFTAFWTEGAFAEKFVEKLKEQNRVLIRYEELKEAFNGRVNSLLFQGNTAKDFAHYLSGVFQLLLQHLTRSAKSKQSSAVADIEIVNRLTDIIEKAGKFANSQEQLEVKTLINLIRQAMQTERVSLEGEPVEGLQIMGLQETRSLDFKNVIVLSANEGVLPSGKNKNTFIPYVMQKEFLQTYQERDAITAYLFYRLLHQAENVFLLYNTEPDELGGGEKSRYILQLQHELSQFPNTKITDKVFAVDPPQAIGERPIIIAKSELIMEKLMEILQGSGLSPSALNTYINCTLQYYFRYIAGLREEDEMEENLDSATIGSAVHHALEKIYEPFIGKKVEEEYLRGILKEHQAVENLIREHLQKRFDNESLARGKNLLLYHVCVKLVKEFVKGDVETLKGLDDNGTGLFIDMLEDELKGTLKVGEHNINIRGRIDRVERIDGVVQIADFKTSAKSKKMPKLDDSVWEELFTDAAYSKVVQLMIYAWLYRQSGGDMSKGIRSGIYWLREKDKMLDTLQLGGGDIIQNNTIDEFAKHLALHLAAMLDTSVPFTKTDDERRCEYCEFVNICGRG